MISPGGEFPVLGRSIAYRAGAFHLLADVARRGMLPAGVEAARGARSADCGAGAHAYAGWDVFKGGVAADWAGRASAFAG